MPRLPAHQVTTRNLGAAYPFIAEAGLGRRGVMIGDDLLGGSFVFDPFELYAAGVVSNPNMVVFGQIGRGKSAFVKTFLWRQAVFGRRAWVVDPKGEYGDLADAWGVRPVALRPGGAIRLNPLDPGPDGATVTPRPVPTPRGAAGWSCSRPWPARASAGGWRPASAPRWGRRLTRPRGRPRCPPCRWWWRPCCRRARTRRGHCAPSDATCSRTGATWRWSCAGSCTATSAACSTGRPRPGLDLSAPLVVLDLSALYSSAALGVLMACATAWLQAALARTAARRAAGLTVGTGPFLPRGRRGLGDPVEGEDSD